MTDELATVILPNGLTVRFAEQTNRYFGDYHRVCILVTLELPESLILTSGLHPEKACQQRRLEKMGVPSAMLDAERSAMLEAFWATSRSYFENEDFPRQLLAKLQQQKNKPVFLRDR